MSYLRDKQIAANISMITFAQSPYTAYNGETVVCDCTGGDIIVNSPPNATRGMRFTVKRIAGPPANLVDVHPSEGQIEATRIIGLQPDAYLQGIGEVWTWVFDGANWRVAHSGNQPTHIEAWLATPITGISGLGQTINWTFQPLYTGQQPVMVSHSLGTFTLQTDLDLDMRLVVEWNFDLTGNNEDAQGVIDIVYAGTGLEIMPKIGNSFAHARSGDFITTNNTDGILLASAGETFRFDAISDPTQSGNTDLVEAALFMGT